MATLAAEDSQNTIGVRLSEPQVSTTTEPPVFREINSAANTPRTEATHFAFSVEEPVSPTSASLLRLREAACYLAFYLAGYNAGVTGTLLPTIEKVYGLDYSSVSALFVAYCVGYLASGFATGEVMRRWGFGRVLVGSGVVMMIGIIINCSQLVSFPLMCFAFFVVGLGYSAQLGMCNSYFATLPRPLLRMGLLHGLYGFGAFTSPIVASIFISNDIPINLFYTTSLGLCVPAIILAYFAFVHGKARYDAIPEEPLLIQGGATPHRPSMKEVLASPAVWSLSLFLLFYVGAEESIGGWIVSFMLQVRHGSTSGSAWVASGFYLGIALGRISLPILNLYIGERRVVLMYILIACGFQAVSWAVNSFLATAVATAFVGFTISTFYTAAIHLASKLLPRRMHTRGLGLISSIGQSGSALFPLIIGVISSKKGIWVVQPSVVALMAVQFVCWSLVPRVDPRID